MTLYYVLLPYVCFGNSNAVLGYLIGYLGQTLAYSFYTAMGLMLERDYKRYWRVMFCLPLASLYCITINFFGCVYGVSRDLVFFGNKTSFAPEWTLMKGGCERVAIAFRARRFVALALRSLIHGDVPVGTFWLGWKETSWTPSGFEGWTTGKAPRPILPRPNRPAATVETPPAVHVGSAPAPARAAVLHLVTSANEHRGPLCEDILVVDDAPPSRRAA
jgi:hypothetical protein